MRNVFLTLSPVLLSASLSAQGVFSNRTQLVLEKAIQDYPNHFFNIKGELISQGSQSSRYKSILQLPGAQSAVITVSTGSQPSGWSCTVLETRSFGEASQRFAAIYGELSNSIIAGAGQKTYILSGQYEIPVAEKKSTCIVFSLLPAVGELKKLKVELALRQEADRWKIQLIVQDKDPRDDAQGAFTSN